MMLFGSYARGEQRGDSDIDVTIILEDFSDACSEIERTGDIVSHYLLNSILSYLLFLSKKKIGKKGRRL